MSKSTSSDRRRILATGLSRRDRLEILVRFLPDAINGGGGGLDWIGSGPGSKLLTYSPLYAAAPDIWDELLRALDVIEPKPRRHLLARFHEGYSARRKVRFSRVGVPHLPERTEIVAGWSGAGRGIGSKPFWLDVTVCEWPGWIEPRLVDEGFRVLSSEFRGPVDIPRVLAA